MDRACDHLFAGAGFAQDEHGRVGRGNLVDAIHHATQSALRTHYRFRQRLATEPGQEGLPIGLRCSAQALQRLEPLLVFERGGERNHSGLKQCALSLAVAVPDSRPDHEQSDNATACAERGCEAGRGQIESRRRNGGVIRSAPDLAAHRPLVERPERERRQGVSLVAPTRPGHRGPLDQRHQVRSLGTALDEQQLLDGQGRGQGIGEHRQRFGQLQVLADFGPQVQQK